MDLNRMLQRAADYHDLLSPDDALGSLVKEIISNDELDENELDFVAAARCAESLQQTDHQLK